MAFHVMFLTRNQQASLRLLMFDLLAKHIRMVMDRAVGVELDQSGANAGYQSIIGAVDSYERIVDILPTLSTLPKSKDMTLQLTPKSMEYVVKAVNMYTPGHTSLGTDQIKFVEPNIKSLVKLINDSKQFTYTEEDVRRARGGK